MPVWRGDVWVFKVVLCSLFALTAADPQQVTLAVARDNAVSHPKGLAPAADDALLKVKVSRRHAFVAPIELGTPPQVLRCLLDSGSSDLWVPSKRCERCHDGHNYFADSSSTFSPKLQRTASGRSEPVPVQVTYGSGQVLGYQVEDTLTFGPWKVTNQSFIIVEDEVLAGGLPKWDGICGLGWQGIAKGGKPLYRRLQELKLSAIFSLVPKGEGKASLVLGEVPNDSQLQRNTLVWVKVEKIPVPQGIRSTAGNQNTFWIISGGLAIHRDKPTQARFLVDTGTNQVLLVPSRYYRSFLSSLLPAQTFDERCGVDNGGGGMVFCECSLASDKSLLPLRIYLGKRQFVIPFAGLLTDVGVRDDYSGEKLCLLQVQPNAMSGGIDPFAGLGGILGALAGSGLDPAQVASQSGGASQSQSIPFSPALPGLIGGPGPAASGSAASNGASDGALGPLAPLLGGAMQGDTTEEEIITEQPGSVCKTIIVHQEGRIVKNETHCEKVGRRLDPMMPMGIPIISEPMEDPMADVWVLGGVFMERFVTIFDFDEARLGFAEPTTEVAKGLARLNLAGTGEEENNLLDITTPAWSLTSMAGVLLVGCAVTSFLIVYAFGRPMLRARTRPLAEDNTATDEEDQPGE